MAKEGNEEGGNTHETAARSPLEELIVALLKRCIKSPSGLTVRVASKDDPVTIVGGEITYIHDGKAWVMFKVDNCLLRTSDREQFLKWVTGGGIEPFSKERGHADLVGPPHAIFTSSGMLPKRPEPKKHEATSNHGSFRSRAYARAGVRVEAVKY